MADTTQTVDGFRFRGASTVGNVLTVLDVRGTMAPRPLGSGLTGYWEPEVIVNPDTGLPEVEFGVNADGEWDIVMAWRAA